MTKPTGNPRGRPKTKEYVTLMARIPQDLADRVKRYAGLHRQSISVVIREGLLLLLESDSYSNFVSDMKKEVLPKTYIAYDMKEESAELVAYIMSDRKTDVPGHGETTQAIGLSEKVSDMKEKEPEIVYDTKETEKNVSDKKEVVRKIVSDKNGAPPETSNQSSGMVPFDTAKYVLGKLCPRRHDHDDTGHSLLRLSNRHCLACDREKAMERKQAKRA